MKHIDIFSLGTVPDFDRTTADDAYFTERTNYEISCMLHNMATAGMTISQAEDSDFSEVADLVNEFVSDMIHWGEDLESWIVGGFEGEQPTVPTLNISEVELKSEAMLLVVPVLAVSVAKAVSSLSGSIERMIYDSIETLLGREEIINIGTHQLWTKSQVVHGD